MPWRPGQERVYDPAPMQGSPDQELDFAVASAKNLPGLPAQYQGDVTTIQQRARPRLQRGGESKSFTEGEERGTLRMEDIGRTRERLITPTSPTQK